MVCPNLNDQVVKSQFDELTNAVGKEKAYALWSLNNGYSLEMTSNGEQSILFQQLLNETGDRNLALRRKAEVYSNSFRRKIGEWLYPMVSENQSQLQELDANGEPHIKFTRNLNNKELKGDSPTTYYTVEDTTIEPKYELFPGVEANEQQKVAIDKLTDFLNNSDAQFATLKGRAGTGKTTIIKKVLMEQNNRKNLMYVAPTHKAKYVLQDVGEAGDDVSTIQSALSIKLNEKTFSFMPDLWARKNGGVPISKAGVVVMDEASMLTKDLFKEMKTWMNPSAKVIFMGDNAQLPPIGENGSDSVSFDHTLVELTERMRQGEESPIVKVSDRIVANIDLRDNAKASPLKDSDRVTEFDKDTNTGIIFSNNATVILEMWKRDFLNNSKNTKIVTYNNETNEKSKQSVFHMNQFARQKLGLNDKALVVKGEQLTAYTTNLDNKKEPIIENSVDYTVISEPVPVQDFSKEIKDKKGNLVAFIKGLSGSYIDVRNNLTGDVSQQIMFLDRPSRKKIQNIIDNFYNKYNKYHAFLTTEAFPRLDYGYVVTAHKSQGSTYRNVYVLEDNLLNQKDRRTNRERSQALYVAVTRGSNKTVIHSSNNPDTGKDQLIDNPVQSSHLDSNKTSPMASAVQEERTVSLGDQVKNEDEVKLFDDQDKKVKSGSVVRHNGKLYLLWNINDSGKAQLVRPDGTKFSGTPDPSNLEVLGSYPTTEYNGTRYIVSNKGNVYSVATGKMVYTGTDNSSRTQKERIVASISPSQGATSVSQVSPNRDVDDYGNDDNIYNTVEDPSDHMDFENPNVEKVRNIAQKAIEELNSIIINLRNSGGSTSELRDIKNRMKFAIRESNEVYSITLFAEKAIQDMSQFLDRFQELGQNVDFTAKELVDMHDVVVSFSNITNKLHHLKDDEVTVEEFKKYGFDLTAYSANSLSQANGLANTIKQHLIDKMEDRAVNFIWENDRGGYKNKEDIRTELKQKRGDIWSLSKNFASMADVDDKILRNMYAAVKLKKDEASDVTIEASKTLANAIKEAKAEGVNSLDYMYERNSDDDKRTGNMLSPYLWEAWFQSKDEVMNELAKSFGYESYSEVEEEISETRALFFQKYESTSPLNVTSAEVDKQNRLLMYTKRWGAWMRENSVKNDEFEEASSIFANERILPSQKWVNKKYSSMTEAQKKLYITTLSVKALGDRALPENKISGRNLFLLPQIRKQPLERFLVWSEGWEGIKEPIKDVIFSREDDDMFGLKGDDSIDLDNQKLNRMIPVYYRKKLSDVDGDMSQDIAFLLAKHVNMAHNFKRMASIAPDLNIVLNRLESRINLNKNKKATNTENATKMFASFLDGYVYGEELSEMTVDLPFFGKQINISKILASFSAYVRRNNLGNNPFTIVTSAITSSIYGAIEDIVGEYSDTRTKLESKQEYYKELITKIIPDMESKVQTSEVQMWMDYFEVTETAVSQFSNSSINKLKRGFINEGNMFFGGYKIFDHATKGQLVISQLNYHRLIDGKFISKKEYKNNGGDMTKWESYPTVRSMFSIDEKGTRQLKEEYKEVPKLEEQLSLLKGKVNLIGDRIDGRVSGLDRSAVSRDALGQTLLLHRNFLVNGISTRMKAKGINPRTGMEDEGYLRTSGRVLKDLVGGYFNVVTKDKENQKAVSKLMSIRLSGEGSKKAVEYWNKLSPMEKRNLLRTALELAAMALMYAIFQILLSQFDDDDDDDWLSQFVLFQAHKTVLELTALVSPIEAVNLIKSPTAIANQLDSVVGFYKSFVFTDELQSGPYKGKNPFEKFVIQRSFLKNVFEAQYPEEKRKWLKIFSK